jgi:uncharacterized protein (TIGR01244 family)
MKPVFIDKNYHVSPQIEPYQRAEIAEKGFVKIICNRPDVEVPDSCSSSLMAKLAAEVGIDFEVLELTHQTMTLEKVKKQREFFINTNGPVLAYCASGTRCSVIWALGEAASGTEVSVILEKTHSAGYDLTGLQPTLQNLSAS